MTAVYIAITILMILLSAWFSASEMAFNYANVLRLKKRQEEGSKAAALALRIRDHFTDTLSMILIGNNLVNIAASTCMTVLFLSTAWSESVATVVSTLVMTILILIFGETTPKLLAKRFPEAFACFSAYPIWILMIIFKPLTFLVMGLVNLLRKIWKKDQKDDDPTVTEKDLETIIDTVEEEGVIDEAQGEMLQSTLDFKDTTVYEIMTPRKDVVSIDISDDLEKNAKIISASRFSRIPVYEDSIDNIIGVLYLNQFYRVIAKASDNSGFTLRSILLPPCLMHKTMKLPAALSMMRARHTHMAIVIDEFGGTMGIVTMEDILEELVGNIWDEYDVIVEECEDLGDNRYRVDGNMSIEDFFEEIEFDAHDFTCEYTTMGGWAVEMLEANPHTGDVFTYENLTVKVESMQNMRVTKLLVTVSPKEEDTEE
ncbi:MAG: HlyC/CorC family transporter [Clostridia bacterium]|nr:HlyC/CorC family transporter [Clostridia bacterium]